MANNVRAPKTTFKTIPYTDIMKQVNGQPTREPVYYFGRTIKVQPLELPGKEYHWARDLPESDNV